MKLVVDDKIPFIQGQAEKIGDTVYIPGAKISAADVKDADILITRTRTQCNASLLEGSGVKFVATATIGFDHIDVDFMKETGIAWTNCPGCNATSVAQYVECVLLLLVQKGSINLSQCTVGVVGVGNVGRRVAERLVSMGCKVKLNDPPRAETEAEFAAIHSELEELAETCDVISFHTPLIEGGKHPTFHLANKTFFQQLKRRPVIINAGRGEVVDTQALLEAMSEERVGEVVIDTWENEPHINRTLLEKAFIGTPHIAGYSADGKANGTRMSLEAIARHFGLNLTFDVRPPELPLNFSYNPDEAMPQDERLRLYDPRHDSNALKKSPESFEHLRGNYPLRREKQTTPDHKN